MSLDTGEIAAPYPSAGSRGRGVSVVLSRWVMVITISYAIIFSSDDLADFWPRHVFVIGILLSNLALIWALSHGASWMRLSLWAVLIDIAALLLATSIGGQVAWQFYVVLFTVLLITAVLEQLVLVFLLTLAACVAYGLLLYARAGSAVLQSPALLLRLPVLLGVALYFGTAVQEARREYERWRRDRALGALSEMGRITSSSEFPGMVLFQIARRVQQVIGVDRCSVVVFERSGQKAFLAASGDDPNVDVLLFRVEEYPELAAALADRGTVELHPGEPQELWDEVQKRLPASSPFRSFLIVPIKARDDVLGVFFLRDSQPDRVFSSASRDFCLQAAHMAAAFVREHDLVEQLHERARRDGLTGHLTFQAFRERAEELLRDSGEHSPPLTLVAVDIDDLGDVNARYGHDTGDRVIREVGARLQDALVGTEAICRHGGDAFIALTRATKDEVQGLLRESFLHGQPWASGIRTGTSIGVASFPVDATGLEQLLAAAQRAVQAARAAGGNCVWPA